MAVQVLLWLAVTPAEAVGGAFAGPIGLEPPTSSATQVVISPGDTANVVTLAVQVAVDADQLAVLWPAAGIADTSAVQTLPVQYDRIEIVTEPRVEELRCDELVEKTHWQTPPGCASYDYVRPPPKRGEDAVDAVAATPAWGDADLYVDVLKADEVLDWLASQSLGLDPAMAEALQPHLDAGESVLVFAPLHPVTAGTWLPPVRFTVPAGDVVLPLTIGAAAQSTRHELHVFGVAPKERGNAAITNFPRAFLTDDCVLGAGQSAAEFLADQREAIRADAVLATWILEYAGRSDACDPCTGDPLTPFELAVFGDPGDRARISRLEVTWEPGQLDQDPVVSFAGDQADADVVFLEHQPDLGFAYPTCGESQLDPNAPVCPNLHLPGSGCDTTRASPLLALALAVLAVRRRKVTGVLAVLVVPGAARAAPVDPGPRTEVAGGLSLVGTDRVVPTGLDHGGPWLGNPLLAVEVRRNLLGWRPGRSVGVLGAVRGMAGDAAPWADGIVHFVLIEPTVALDLRHGKLREASPCWFGRYGLDLTTSILDPSVSPAQVTLSGGLHGGVGAWVGRGPSRTAIELRASVIARSDGIETEFDPALALPGWMFYPGAAQLWLVVGRAFY